MATVIGIDLGGTNIVGALMKDNNIIEEIKVPTEAKKGSTVVLDNIAKVVNQLLVIDDSVKAVGIGTPGAVDENGVISGAFNIPGWDKTDLYRELSKRVTKSLKFVAGNDVDVAALGESMFGNQPKVKTMLFVALGTGIGGGLVVDNKIFTGAAGNALEIGHMSIELDGRKCTCGKNGCFETYGSATGIKRTFVHEYENSGDSVESTLLNDKKIDDVTTKDIYDYAKRGDLFCKQVTNVVNYHMAVGIGNLANIFNPDLIVIGGGVSLAGDYFFEPLKEELKKHCFEKIYNDLKLVPSTLQDRAGLYGACALAVNAV